MAKKSSSTISQKRKPRLLWANPFCLLDTSSGASMTVRQMLHQLVQHGYEIQVLGCTIFDNPKGMGRLKEQYPDFKTSLHQLIEIEDGALSHQLVVTARTTRNHLTTHEEGLWYSQYLYMLDSFKPDIVWFYGGQTLDLLIPDEARARGIPSAFYLANGNYKAVRWCRDIDLILTDSQSTADMYRTSKNAGFAATPVGKFIDPANFVAETHERKRLLFVNPSWQKGASVVVQLALALEQKRPDIQLEVVEARADWSAVLRETTEKLGKERTTLPNVVVTPNTSDMRGPYSRARLLLAPSLWWESSGRVLAEAMLNGVPALITNRGGMPEMIGDAGIAFDFPEECYEAPHQHLLNEEQLQPLYDAVLDFNDDTALYEEYVQRAWTVGKQCHHIDQATERLTRALAPFVKLRAGNKDFTAAQQKRHRQGLASIASKPTFKVDASLLLQNQKPGRSEKSMPLVRGDFDWQIEGKIIVLDSRAKLLKMGAAENLTKTGAFGIIAFDPASEVSDPKQYEGSETTQVFQHALLGDGNPATLHTCLDASMSSTLEPLPQEELPGQYQQGAKVLTKLPINTIALDSIEGLPGLDWLILDELSDTATILEHGQQALKETLIIQARVAFQPTHKHQPSLTELQHWASRNGFRFYRFNESQHASHLPEEIPEERRQATELVSADALFLPSHARTETLSKEQRTRLAFLLSTVFGIKDFTHKLLSKNDAPEGNAYLLAEGIKKPRIETLKNKGFKKNKVSRDEIIWDETVFIVGCGHSGTTLMASLLGAHPSIYTIPKETYWFLNNQKLDTEYPKAKHLAEKEGKRIVCEKTPRHVYRIKNIKERFPNAKIIAMVRDSKDVVSSLKNRSGDFNHSIQRWLSDNQALLEFTDRKWLKLIRYEDLVTKKESTMHDILSFLDLPYTEEVFDFHKKDYNWFGLNNAQKTDGRGEKNHMSLRSWQMTQPIHDKRGVWKKGLSKEEASLVDKRCHSIEYKLASSQAACLRNDSIKVFGDSHSQYIGKYETTLPILVNIFHGATILGLGKRQSTLQAAKKIKDSLKPEDFVVLGFGQVDLELGLYYRKIIKKEEISLSEFLQLIKISYEEFIYEIKNYCAGIILKGVNLPVIKDHEKAVKYVSRIISENVTSDREKSLLEGDLYSSYYSYEKRVYSAKKMNEEIASIAKENSCGYFDINNYISTTTKNEVDEKYIPKGFDHHVLDTVGLHNHTVSMIEKQVTDLKESE